MLDHTDTPPQEKTIAIVGVGLIGGSLAAAIKHRKLAKCVIGVGRDQARIDAAKKAGLIDEATVDVAEIIQRANIVVFCTPVDRVAKDVRLAEAALAETVKESASQIGKSDLLLTDVGSVKEPICSDLADIPNFIGSHPIAGSHRQGFEAADPQLFQGRVCVVTPLASAANARVERLEHFWQSVGMRTTLMSPSMHDQSLALTSHLPHVVAAALATILTQEKRSLTGTGFRDTTRIAAGAPQLWTSILMNNAEFIVRAIDEFGQRLERFREALSKQDASAIEILLREGQLSRNALEQTPPRIE